METIRVNMTPCEDIKTIHASQNDNEAREWGFELHNNGEKIDSSSISDQMVFKSYEGGTEQILPENGAVPVTAPFVGDIKYPDVTRNDQEFLYRQSPTEEDGLAKITDVKGNTLVWNQLIQNGNFANGTDNWTQASATISASNGELTVTIGGTWNNDARQNLSLVAGHKYLGCFKVKSDTLTNVGVTLSQFGLQTNITIAKATTLSPTYQTIVGIATVNESSSSIRCVLSASGSSYIGQSYTIKDVMLFDLTAMGLDITDPSEFTSLFPLPYYDYNQGTLLSFMGNGIKTVGKNLLNARTTYTNNGITFTNDNGVITINGTATANAYFTTDVNLRNGSYFISTFNDGINTNVHITIRNESGAYPLDIAMSAKNMVASLNNDVNRFLIYVKSGATLNNFVMKPMVSFESPEYFEPYTSSTLSLPISTYFPSGMDGVPYSSSNPTIVYDELTDTKAIKRTNKVIYDGSNDENWQLQSINSYNIANFTVIIDDYVPSTMNSSKCNIFTSQVSAIAQTQTEGYFLTFDKRLYIRISSSKASTVEQFRTWLASNNIEFVYRLATPTETSFTTASLVTENAEIPLSNEDGTLIGKCTEQLSENPGFIDAKIKLSDGDGECYSNKLQLHVERSPQ